MKTVVLFLIMVVYYPTTQAQTIRRVNNNPGVTGVNVYASVQSAHDAANPNDILMIEPSSISYGNLVVTKPITVYGSGFFKSTNTELMSDQRSSTLGEVSFGAGCSGSSFYSLVISTFRLLNNGLNLNSSISNLTIERCLIQSEISINTPYNSSSIGTHNVANIIVRRNYLGSISMFSTSPAVLSNVIISNNIITGNFQVGVIQGNGVGDVSNVLVQYNTIKNFAGAITNYTLKNAVFENNILTNPDNTNGGYSLGFVNVTMSNNISHGNHFPAINGNQNNVNVAAALVGSGAGISLDEAYQPKAGSSLKTAGSGGTEVGAFGGPTPYVISGIPPFPTIQTMLNTGTGSNTTPVQVTISVKSNN